MLYIFTLNLKKENPKSLLDSADIHCPLGFTPYEWKSSFLMSACLCFCLQAFFFSSCYTMYPSPGQ